jgi:hypothetical protein
MELSSILAAASVYAPASVASDVFVEDFALGITAMISSTLGGSGG